MTNKQLIKSVKKQIRINKKLCNYFDVSLLCEQLRKLKREVITL